MCNFRLGDCLEESSRKTEHPKLQLESLRCARQLIFTLDSISNGTGINEELSERIRKKFPSLSEADYKGEILALTFVLEVFDLHRTPLLIVGPTSYDGTSKLPKEYQEILSRQLSSSSSAKADDDEKVEPDLKDADNAIKEEPQESEEDDKAIGVQSAESELKSDEREEAVNEEENGEQGTDSKPSEPPADDDASPIEEPGNQFPVEEDKPARESPTAAPEDNPEEKVNPLPKLEEKIDVPKNVPEEKNDEGSEMENDPSKDASDSEDTEGPEEGFDEDPANAKLDTYIAEAEDLEREAALFHNSRIPKSLVCGEELCNGPASMGADDEDEDAAEAARNEMERENARSFVDRLKAYMDTLINARGSVEVDYKLQEFASKFCEGTTELATST